MVYNGVDYFPTLYVPNVRAGHPSRPVVALGFGYETDDEVEYIPGWIFDDVSLQNIEILINEDEADNIEAPVFIISNATLHEEEGEESPELDDHGEHQGFQRPVVNGEAVITCYKIAHRYETDSRSNYRYSIRAYCSGGMHKNPPKGIQIANIHKNDINVGFFNQNKELEYLAASGTLYGLYGATFEYDWYASNQTVIFDYKSFKLRMKYSHEYYQLFYIPKDYFKTFSSKGYICIDFD